MLPSFNFDLFTFWKKKKRSSLKNDMFYPLIEECMYHKAFHLRENYTQLHGMAVFQGERKKKGKNKETEKRKSNKMF